MGVREHLRWSSAVWLLAVGRTAVAAPPAAAPEPAAEVAPSTSTSTSTPAAKKLTAGAALRAATTALASASPSEVRQGLLALAELSGDAPARALADRMRAGLPPALIGEAIDVAVQLGSPRAVPALSELLQHKRAAVRKQAIGALAALKAKTAQAALITALDDPDGEVRAAAIEALAELKATRALPQLLALVTRGQPGALQAIGKLAGARDMTALLAKAPGGDVTPLKPALQAWVADERRMPAQQLELIAAMTKVASPSARTYLVEWLDAAKSAGNPRVRTALFAAIKQLDDASQAAAQKTSRTVVQGVQVSDAHTPAATAPEIARAESPERTAGTAVSPDHESTARGGAR